MKEKWKNNGWWISEEEKNINEYEMMQGKKEMKINEDNENS